MSNPRFVLQEAVRCEDCDIRGDLHDTGYPLLEARGRIHGCMPCGGRGHHDVTRGDPYDGVDTSDPWVRRRANHAEARNLVRAPRALRRRFFETARLEALMQEDQ